MRAEDLNLGVANSNTLLTILLFCEQSQIFLIIVVYSYTFLAVLEG